MNKTCFSHLYLLYVTKLCEISVSYLSKPYTVGDVDNLTANMSFASLDWSLENF